MILTDLLKHIECGTKVKIINNKKETAFYMCEDFDYNTLSENNEVINIKNGVDTIVISVK